MLTRNLLSDEGWKNIEDSYLNRISILRFLKRNWYRE